MNETSNSKSNACCVQCCYFKYLNTQVFKYYLNTVTGIWERYLKTPWNLDILMVFKYRCIVFSICLFFKYWTDTTFIKLLYITYWSIHRYRMLINFKFTHFLGSTTYCMLSKDFRNCVFRSSNNSAKSRRRPIMCPVNNYWQCVFFHWMIVVRNVVLPEGRYLNTRVNIWVFK